MRIKLTISYIGTNYSGWQSQKNKNAIQDKVEQALSAFFDGQFVRIFAAGRTDVGVHAVGQVAHFDIDKKVNPYKLCLGANLNLPPDIAITDAEIVPESFDARFGAVSKTYCYRLYVSATRKPLLDIDHHQIYRPLDIEKMKLASKYFVGTHDFSAFQKTGSNLKGTVRTINSIELVSNIDDTIEIKINGNAFLYNMIRIIVGTLVKIGKNEILPDEIPEIIKNGNRKTAGKTLPAKGLTLEKVFY